MNKWLIRIGTTLLVIAAVLISPLMDLLPVDFWPSLLSSIVNLFSSESEHVYLKVVPSTELPSNFHIYVLITIGIIMIALGKFYKPRTEKH